ncbi:MFS general substrate transporter [Panus rudis PR-1116 ss-1]|nr:MFS general substrate transporter [Panus rudis PR-1116 ss-1]
MIITYRYVKKRIEKRRQERAQAANAAGNTQGEGVSPGPTTPLTTDAFPPVNLDVHTESAPVSSSGTSLKWKIMLMIGLVLPVFLETLDYTVVATAQVHIASVFNRLDLQSYIGTVYLLTSTVFLPLFASIADVFGRHWTLQIALLFFMVGSAISTGSQNMPTMLAGRGVAGVGAAGLLASVRIILTDSSSLDDNNWQMSILFALYTVGYCLGPFIGGELVTVSFRWVFAINLPCCAVAIVIAFILLRGRVKGGQTDDDLPGSSKKLGFLSKLLEIDWLGGFLFMASGILVLLALNWGSTEKWDSAKVIACFVVGGVLMIACLGWEYHLQRKHSADELYTGLRKALYTFPMIPLSLFKSLDINVVMFAVFVGGMIMTVMFYFVAIFMTIVNDYAPNKAGAQLLYFAPGLGGGSISAILLIKWTRQASIHRAPKIPIILSGIVSTISLGLISDAMHQNNTGRVNGFMAMAGVGVGLGIGPLAVHARFSQPEERVAIVAALTLFFRSFGGTVGLAQCGAVLNGKVTHYINELVRSGAISGAAAQAFAGATASGLSSTQSIQSLPPEIQTLVKDAFREATRWCFISLIPWSGLSFIGTLFLSSIQDRARKRVTGVNLDSTRGEGVETEKREESELDKIPKLEENPA